MVRDRYYVNTRKDGKWEVFRQGGEKPSAVTETKSEAVSRGAEIAGNRGHSQLIIRKRDGTFQEERTYGDDPYPPEG